MIYTSVSLATRLVTSEVIENPKFFDFITTSSDISASGTEVYFLVEVWHDDGLGVTVWAALVDIFDHILVVNPMWKEPGTTIRFWAEVTTAPLEDWEIVLINQSIRHLTRNL